MSRLTLYKLVVLGDGGVGKTALTIQLCLNHFVEAYDPTIEDSYRKQVVIDSQACMLEILDTAGQDEYRTLRDQWIREGEGFILVYAVNSRKSFKAVEEFHKGIQRAGDMNSTTNSRPGHPGSGRRHPIAVMLVGNKDDLHTEREVSYQEGQAMATKLGCLFTEASAKHNRHVEKAYYDVVRQMRRNREGPSRQGRTHTTSGGGVAKGKRYEEKRGRQKRGPCVIL